MADIQKSDYMVVVEEVWWSVKPNTSKGYTYSGLITITFSDNTTRIYPVSKSGKRRSIS